MPRAPPILVITYTARIAASNFAHFLFAHIEYRRMVTWLGTSSNAALAFDGISVTWPAVLATAQMEGWRCGQMMLTWLQLRVWEKVLKGEELAAACV